MSLFQMNVVESQRDSQLGGNALTKRSRDEDREQIVVVERWEGCREKQELSAQLLPQESGIKSGAKPLVRHSRGRVDNLNCVRVI